MSLESTGTEQQTRCRPTTGRSVPRVALKTPNFARDPTGEQKERLFREARTAGNLRHPSICPIHDFGEIEGRPFISMAYIEGRPLSAFVASDPPQTEAWILTLVRKLALALRVAHDQGVIHRDLKPSNVMIDAREEPIIMDFGLARQERRGKEDVRLTQSGVLVGSPAYMSPEQVEGDAELSGQSQRRELLLEEIQAIHQERRKEVYGSPRIHQELTARGRRRNVKTVARIMKEQGIRARTAKRFKVTTDTKHDRPVAPNVHDRAFDQTAPNQAWVSDITYVPTREGWLYLAAVEDLCTRKIVGWSMSERLTSRLVVDALEMAIQRQLPGEGLLSHSDRGSQYASEHYQELLKRSGIKCSMSR